MIFSTASNDFNTTCLDVVVFYEDKDAGLCAKRICDMLRDSVPGNPEIGLTLYRFDVLGIEAVEEEAFSVAEHSRLVIVVAKDTGKIPSNLSEWIETKTQEQRFLSPIGLYTPKAAEPLSVAVWEAFASVVDRVLEHPEAGNPWRPAGRTESAVDG